MRPSGDLVVVCIRLRRADIDRAKTIAARTGLGYQRWVRERVSAAVQDGANGYVWKLCGTSALAIVRADTIDAARTATRLYGEALATESKLPAAPFVSWIENAKIAELPTVEGVVAWAGVGPPPSRAGGRRRRRRGRAKRHRR